MFSSKRSLTLLVVTSTEVMRADCRLGSEVKIDHLARDQRPAQTPLATAAELAAGLSDAKPSQRTVMVADDFWTGVVDLDQRSIYGLEGDELNQMLRFETESLSGLDPMTSHLAVAELAPVPPDIRRFWAIGISGEELASVSTMISLRGGRLVQLAHPIGLASPAAAGQAWIEFHSELAGAFAIVGEGGARAAIAPRSKTSDRWYRSLQTGFGDELPKDGWITPGTEQPETYDGSLQLLESDETIERWIHGVIRRLEQDSTAPVVVPPTAPTSTRVLTRIGTAAAFAAAVACGAHFASVSWTKTSIAQQIEELKEPAAEKKRLEGELKQVQKKIEGLKTELEELGAQRSDLTALTARVDRFSELLRLIAESTDENLVVDEILTNASGMQLVGRSIVSRSPSQLARRLAPPAERLGWKVDAPELEGQNKLTNGGPWKFRIDLVDVPVSIDTSLIPTPENVVRRGGGLKVKGGENALTRKSKIPN